MARHRNRKTRPGKVHRGSEVVAIRQLADTGEGIATLEGGKTVFVQGALPDETVRVGWESAGKTAHGTIREVVEGNPHRVEPPCSYATKCGGCDWMHIGYAHQIDQKQARLERVLKPFVTGKIEVKENRDPLAYRTRARLAVEVRSGRVTIGYRGRRRRNIVDVESCAVLVPQLEAVLPELRAALVDSHGKGELQLNLDQHKLVCGSLRWEHGDVGPGLVAAVGGWMTQTNWSSFQIWLADATVPLRFGTDALVVPGADNHPLACSADSFQQASWWGGHQLGHHVAALVAKRPRNVIELFAGCGTLTVALGAQAERVLAVESDPRAVACLRSNVASRDWKHVSIKEANVDEIRIPEGISTVVLDPPRAGAKVVLPTIAAARPRQIVYVSCAPMTLARDLKFLTDDAYEVADATAFDLFPQTHHVETIVHLERRTTR